MTDSTPEDADGGDDSSATGGPETATRADSDRSDATDENSATNADDGHDYPDPGEPLSATEALEILGEETRARIVVELGEAVRDDGIVPAPLSFSELMERVGAADSGRFNYHLDKLVGTFVYKTEAGYLLGPPGHFLYRAVVSGRLTERESVEPFEVGPCPDCGESLLAEYPANSCFYVRCPACETFQHAVELPASGFEGRTPREALTAGVRRRHHEAALLRHGVCHGCGAAVERRLDDGDHEAWEAFYGHDVYAAMSCSVCSVGGFGHPALAALVTPPVVAFFHDHGRDAFGATPWEAPLPGAKAGTTVHDDGDRVTVPFELDGDRLRVTLDDDLAVVATERR